MNDRRDLEQALIERLEPLALQCPEGDFDWDTWIIVDDFTVQTAARCAAKVAGPPDDFEATVFTTFKTLAKEAAKVLGVHGGDVRGALMDVVRRGRGGDDSVPLWLADYLFGCDTPELVATVQRAATWLERTRTVLDEPDLDRYVVDNRYQWDHPAEGLRLRGRVDLVGEGTVRPVMVVPSLDDARLDQLAYLAVLHQLGRKGASDQVAVAVHSTGSVETFEVTDLAERAMEATSRAVQAVLARGSEPSGLTRRPSYFTCQECAWFDGCEPRLDLARRTEVVRRGVRLAL